METHTPFTTVTVARLAVAGYLTAAVIWPPPSAHHEAAAAGALPVSAPLVGMAGPTAAYSVLNAGYPMPRAHYEPERFTFYFRRG